MVLWVLQIVQMMARSCTTNEEFCIRNEAVHHSSCEWPSHPIYFLYVPLQEKKFGHPWSMDYLEDVCNQIIENQKDNESAFSDIMSKLHAFFPCFYNAKLHPCSAVPKRFCHVLLTNRLYLH